MGKLTHWKEGNTLTINRFRTSNSTVVQMGKEEIDRTQALEKIQYTRLKLQQILKRHEKIESILQDVKKRIVPIQFLLEAADEKHNPEIELENVEDVEIDENILDVPDALDINNLISPYRELKSLRVNQLENIGRKSIETLENMPDGDWKKMLKNLNDWYMEMEPTESLETLNIEPPIAVDLDEAEFKQ